MTALFMVMTYTNTYTNTKRKTSSILFAPDRGAMFTEKINQPYRRVVLVQGGLEIPCEVKAEMIATEKNQHILAHYFDLVNMNYIDILLKRK